MRIERFACALALSVAATAACNALTGAADLEVGACADCGSTFDAGGDAGGHTEEARCDCQPAAPAGWQGPMAVLESSGPITPECGELAVAFQGGAGPSGARACSPCTCGAPAVRCGISARVFESSECSVPGTEVRAAPGECAGTQRYCTAATIGATAIDGGGCPADGGQPPSVTWAGRAVGCALAAPSDRACPPDRACSPRVIGARACISRSGDVPCPPGPYQSRFMYFAATLDSRTCSPCTCAPLGPLCAGGAATFYTEGSCTGFPVAVSSAAPCTAIGYTGSRGGSVRITTAPTTTGGCAADGGRPGDGGVLPDDPTTICCLP